MRRLWRQLAIATNWPVLVALAVLSTAGILSLWQQSPDMGHRQLIYTAVSVACLAAIQAVSYTTIGRYAWGFYLLSLLLVLYTIAHLPGVLTVNGASAWIDFRFMSLEPSELMKIAFVMVLARYLRFRSNYRMLTGLLPPFALALVPMLLILKQPDLGIAALFIPTLLAMLYSAGARGKHILMILGLGAVLAPVILLSGTDYPVFRHMPMLLQPYQVARVTSMLSSDPRITQKEGYQRERALAAMGAGGLTGKGLGNAAISRSVPEWYDDMIFAVIGEQFGFIGSIVVLTAYIVLFAAGVEISAGTREPFGKLVALGVVALLASQTLLNLMVVMGLFPVTGVTLPFVSYGGSSLLASYIAAGLLLNIGQNRPLVIARNAFEFR
jgi:rod shape determining protein RodA